MVKKLWLPYKKKERNNFQSGKLVKKNVFYLIGPFLIFLFFIKVHYKKKLRPIVANHHDRSMLATTAASAQPAWTGQLARATSPSTPEVLSTSPDNAAPPPAFTPRLPSAADAADDVDGLLPIVVRENPLFETRQGELRHRDMNPGRRVRTLGELRCTHISLK